MKSIMQKIGLTIFTLLIMVALWQLLPVNNAQATPNTRLNLMVADPMSPNYRVEAQDADFPIPNAVSKYKSNLFINNIDWSTLMNTYALWMYLGPQADPNGASTYTHTPHYALTDVPYVLSDNRAWNVYKCTGGAMNCATDSSWGFWNNTSKWQLLKSCSANSYDCGGSWLGETNSSVYYVLTPQAGQ